MLLHSLCSLLLVHISSLRLCEALKLTVFGGSGRVAWLLSSIGVQSSSLRSSSRKVTLHPTLGSHDAPRSMRIRCTMGHGGSFRTEVNVEPWPSHAHVGYDDSFFLIGSCFSEKIGQKLLQNKLQASVNPSHGLIFSPLSTAASLDRMVSGIFYNEEDPEIVFNNATGLWCSLEHHSTFSRTSRRDCVAEINEALLRGRDRLLSATCIFITLGSAWVFRHRESRADVANCHKLPGYCFDRRIVTVDEIARHLHESISNLLLANPKARVIITVSPVRHWRDGAVDNARSKAHLLAGTHDVIDSLGAAAAASAAAAARAGSTVGAPGHVSYFPAYELVNDDLRDYRFFEPDMIHPNSVAVDYVWDKLVGALFSDEAIDTMEQVDKVIQAIRHRPFNPLSEAHQHFLRQQLERLNQIEREHPGMILDKERAHFELNLKDPTVSTPTAH